MKNASVTGLRAVLGLAGMFTAFTGVNIAFGGIPTLGWQGVGAFFEVTNEQTFLVQDSHIRFLGGVWIGVGAAFLVACSDPRRYRTTLNFVFALIFLGGLARLTQMHPEVTLGANILGSFVAEVAGMPILYFWLAHSVGRLPGEARPARSLLPKTA